jgi:hypothetical protein
MAPNSGLERLGDVTATVAVQSLIGKAGKIT